MTISVWRIWGVLLALLLLLYPLLAYWGLTRWEPRYLGLALVVVYLLRGLILANRWHKRLAISVAAVLVGVGFWLLNSEPLLRLVPSFISLCAAAVFGYGLLRPPTLPARMAKRILGTLEPEVESYTTAITWIWLVFFLCNAAVAAITALWMSREVWALYNGLIAYGLVAVLFALEYLYRVLVFHARRSS